MTITILMKLKLRECDHVFRDGWEPGVLVMQEVDIAIEENQKCDFELAWTLLDHERDFIARHIVVEMEEKQCL